MMQKRRFRSTDGSSSIEFAIAAPIFFAMMFGVAEIGMMMWGQFGLQHGAEMAARCATINTATCSSPSTIQNFAVQQTYGFNPPPATFSYSAQPCGNQVLASYTYNFATTYFGTPSVTLSGASCYPK